MVMKKTCRYVKASGKQCQAWALQDSEYCFMHDPLRAKERQEARRLGGLRRRREKATSQVYDWAGLRSASEVRRLLEVAVVDTLGLDNSPARSRTLGQLASLSLKTLEMVEVEHRLSALEKAVRELGSRV
jgi:hypothetical protein